MTHFLLINRDGFKQSLLAASLVMSITPDIYAADEPLNLQLPQLAPANSSEVEALPLASEEKPDPVPTVSPTNTPEAITDCISRDAEGRFLGWLDTQHCMLSNRTTTTAQWFDGLFGHDYDVNEAKLRLRVTNDFNWFEGDGFSSKIRFRASAVLPNAKRRLRLIVSDDEDTLHPERNQYNTSSNPPRTSAAIRWVPDYLSRVKYTFDIGIHSTPDIYARARGQRAWRISDSSIIKFTETLRYGIKEKGKSLTQLELERLLNDKTVFRLGNALQYWQGEPEPVGLRWSQDWSILHRLGQQKTVSYGVVFDGVQQPNWHMDTDSLFVLYRQSFWRSWLYYEIEPHLTHYRNLGWDLRSSIIFRLEANFGG